MSTIGAIKKTFVRVKFNNWIKNGPDEESIHQLVYRTQNASASFALGKENKALLRYNGPDGDTIGEYLQAKYGDKCEITLIPDVPENFFMIKEANKHHEFWVEDMEMPIGEQVETMYKPLFTKPSSSTQPKLMTILQKDFSADELSKTPSKDFLNYILENDETLLMDNPFKSAKTNYMNHPRIEQIEALT